MQGVPPATVDLLEKARAVQDTMAQEKSNEFGGGIGCLVLVGLALYGLVSAHNSFWGEQEGTIKTSDCRKTIPVKEDSADTWFKKFICTYRRTNKGIVMSGYCEAVEIDNGVCETVYSYQKKINNGECSDPKFRYLGEDDMCHSDPQ